MKNKSFYRHCFWLILTGIFVVISFTACHSFQNNQVKSEQPAKLLHSDHILVDNIWDVQGKKVIDKNQLIKKLLNADYVLLGEIHDNISHHKNEAWVVDNLAMHDRLAAVSFEMIDNEQGRLIENENIDSATTLIELLNQYKTSWGYETYYRLLFDRVIAANIRIHPANINRKTINKIVMKGEQQLDQELQQILDQTPLSSEQRSDMEREIILSHCGYQAKEMIEPMIRVQRIRDAAMAASLLNSKSDIKILIAGSGHVRNDHGVPIYLHQEEKDANVISVALYEIQENAIDINTYIKQWDNEKIPFDYVWFTATAEREDPCIKLKQHFKHKNET